MIAEPSPAAAPNRLCVFCDAFGAPSMTFVYRQLVGLGADFDAYVLTRGRRNPDLFPFEPVLEIERMRLSWPAALRRQLLRIPRKTRYSSLEPYVDAALEQRPTDLVHCHYGPLGLAALAPARSHDIPLLVTFHGFDASELLGDPVYVDALQPLFAYATVICVSKTMRERLISLGALPERTIAHYIGVPVENIAFVERTPVAEKIARGEQLVFLQVARFVEKKGHEVTLRAFAEFAPRTPGARLILAGDGPLRERCVRLADELGISERVEFPGEVGEKQAVALMAEADVFVHHSVTPPNGDNEGIPTVIMEAMASGLPVVSTLHSGIPELVVDGTTGYLVAENDVAGYVERLERVLTDDGSLGRAGRERVLSTFNLTTQNKLLEEVYRAAVSQHHSSEGPHRH